MTTPWKRYQADLKREGFSYDESQEAAVKALQAVYDGLVASSGRGHALMRGARGMLRLKQKNVKGLYFWGGVGRGKTYLMDTFFDSLPFPEKKRLHFHHFMKLVHEQLQVHRGKPNPLDIVATEFAKEARVLCFDEFFVTDIGDAMILANLLRTLFESGVTLVATSNIEPENLYKNGLQRGLFLPAIELLKQNTTVLNVDGGTDYRLRTLTQVEIFHSPLDEKSENNLMMSFQKLVPDLEAVKSEATVEVMNREIPVRFLGDDVALFDFNALCDGPRSQNDYIEIARCFHAVLVSNVPVFNGGNDDAARRFINMVDEFYDRNVKLLMTSEAEVEHLYKTGKLGFEFQRTVSRLLEMKSEEYLGTAHRA
ncbi:cell division protein ZapE [Reinekea marinisedimentorum]|uniref:Cell division protein ZapE n=1 Tax=Reinekea marinisedimentorum TaxID=230495 RepID=A0A4R3HWW5_9GAMM|nr:cell division protein ZapE [Reinekea marinisedimentorum]TCS37638.1 cell division protein ZapE [Reinekea marinisedimentorum]